MARRRLISSHLISASEALSVWGTEVSHMDPARHRQTEGRKKPRDTDRQQQQRDKRRRTQESARMTHASACWRRIQQADRW